VKNIFILDISAKIGLYNSRFLLLWNPYLYFYKYYICLDNNVLLIQFEIAFTDHIK